MKRMIKAARAEAGADLHIEYLSSSLPGEVEVRSMTVKRPTFSEAIKVMLEHLELPECDVDDMALRDWTKDDVIENIVYANGYGADADRIFYFEDRATGEVFIDDKYPEEVY